ncbi:norsolorinic acid reductase [Ascobolus immersus RN42]|uniref:Norsolorinic acid reductase n=1 Tax=Ascobolus immersus RN42 TaxID=1160509 RepID=A0A3N4HTG2_ASCIM|nr:norsolorinic acid reductase [Ascobolus immersus RN42]
MSPFDPAPKPSTNLGYHRILSPNAGVRVSPLCLGAMSFGTEWSEFMGSCDKNTVFEILDTFRASGGNFIDTANNYQNEQSEKWIGEWMESRKCRDEMVIATKYTTYYPAGGDRDVKLKINFQGNDAKSLRLSVDDSLKKLKTDYIDLLYLHWWDYTTSIPEIMQSLSRLVQAGKVLYLGISDTPAWIVSKANQYARDHGLTQFSVYQGLWNAATRDFEREIIPMCEAEGMALCPWGPLGQGRFKTEEQWARNEGRKMGPATANDRKISKVLEEIGKRKGASLTGVALAYVLHKAPYVFPIVGCRTIDHLKGNHGRHRLGKINDPAIILK